MRRLFRQSFYSMTPVERRRTIGMYGSILLLHALGFIVFIVYVLPAHYKFFGIGLSLTAYTLGLRHAFDADHISAIDNTTRKVMNERQGTDKPRPFAFGYFFSLGHSTIVIAIGVGIIIAAKTVLPAVTHSNSSLESFGGDAHLALRPHRGEMDRPPPGRQPRRSSRRRRAHEAGQHLTDEST